MMNTYRQGGDARVYWLTLPLPRDRDLQEVARAVNAAIGVAAEPYRAQVRVLDMAELFTPGGRYRDAMEVDGRRQIVRDADGIHLNAEAPSWPRTWCWRRSAGTSATRWLPDPCSCGRACGLGQRRHKGWDGPLRTRCWDWCPLSSCGC